MSTSVLENHLRQRIVLLEDSLARIASTRKELHDNVDVVKNEVRLSFGHQLSRLRHREQQILEKLDTVASVKDGILSQQQDQLHQALGACTQGLDWLQTAYEDMKTNRLTSTATVEQRIGEILNKLSSMDIMPRETSHVSFDADPVALRRAISSFGQVRSTSASRYCESLPCGLEDYEDEDSGHTLLHKTVFGTTQPITTITFGQPKLSTDPKDWLLKEALTWQAPKENNHSSNFDTNCEPRCTSQNKRHDQVHNWLHQIKNLVENEPAVFEDFEIVKKRLSSANNQGELAENVCCDLLFRPYFETILNSPAQDWLFEKSAEQNLLNKIENMCYSKMENADDLESCNSSFTFNSDSIVRVGEMNEKSEIERSFGVDEYGEYWRQFLEKLWSSSDSMWLLPCASNTPTQTSDDFDVMDISECRIATDNKKGVEFLAQQQKHNFGGDTAVGFPSSKWMSSNEGLPKNQLNQQQQQQQRLSPPANTVDGSNSFSVDFAKLVGCRESAVKNDNDQWLFHPKLAPALTPPSNCAPPVQRLYEDAIGWKMVLEKVHGLGDEMWLHRPQAQAPLSNVSSTTAVNFSYPSN